MALTTITGNMVSVNAIQGTLIADNAITAVHIATNAVSGTLIADNAVTAVHIAQNSITVTQLADDCVESDKIADGIITTNHLNSAMISSQTEVTAATGDFVLLGDTSDSNNLKKTPVSSIIGLASGTTINNNADNRLITGSGTANTLEGEANLIFDGTNLGVGQASDGDKLHVLGQGFFEDSRANGVGIQINGGSASEFAHIGVSASNPLTFQTANTTRLKIDGSGHVLPGANNTYDLGSTALGWRNIYTNDLNLSNMPNTGLGTDGKEDDRAGNEVDGTQGSWTIQEGANDLFLINRNNGKKYKFNLTEVTG